MAVTESWSDPDTLDRATGDVLTEVIWDGVVSNEAWIAGQTSTGHIQSIRLGIPVDNSTGGTLTAGTLVYVSGYDASTSAPQVTKADGDSRLAEYVLQADIANGAAGYAFRGYTLGSLDTSGSSVGDPIYLSATAGGWTATALTGSAQLSQRVGVVVTSHASTGSVLFDLPGELLKIGSGQIQSGAGGGPSQANQAALEAETNEDTYAAPDLIRFSPGVGKFWVKTGYDASVLASYNVTSVTDVGTGLLTVTIADDFTSASWAVTACTETPYTRSTNVDVPSGSGQLAGSVAMRVTDNNGTLSDGTYLHVAGWGTQV
jgi:hypothetical protein